MEKFCRLVCTAYMYKTDINTFWPLRCKDEFIGVLISAKLSVCVYNRNIPWFLFYNEHKCNWFVVVGYICGGLFLVHGVGDPPDGIMCGILMEYWHGMYPQTVGEYSSTSGSSFNSCLT